MAIKTFNPTTPSRRNMTVLSFKGLSKVKPEKSLLVKLKKTAGRNSYGRITVRHHGGGNKQKYRIIDFKRQKMEMPATVMTLEYDPNRSANIPGVRTTIASTLNVYDILNADMFIMDKDAVQKLEEVYA